MQYVFTNDLHFIGSDLFDYSSSKFFTLDLYNHLLISSHTFNRSHELFHSLFLLNCLKCVSASHRDNSLGSRYNFLLGFPCIFAWIRDIFGDSLQLNFLPMNYCTYYGNYTSDILGLLSHILYTVHCGFSYSIYLHSSLPVF